MPLKTKRKHYDPIIETDENGKLVFFKIPFAALYYDLFCVRLKDQDRVDDTMDELIEYHFSINEN